MSCRLGTMATIYRGHALEVLRLLPSESVRCVVTSPPYFRLRNYKVEPLIWGGRELCEHEWTTEQFMTDTRGMAGSTLNGRKAQDERHYHGLSRGCQCSHCGAWRGSLGLEPTPELYVQHLVEVFREVRRVLKKDGTVWLNLGSSYMTSPRGNSPGNLSTSSLTNPERQDVVSRGSGPSRFRSRRRVPAYDNDGTRLPDSTGVDSAYSDLCDECLADFLSRHARNADSDQRPSQSGRPRSQTDRDSEPSDCALAFPGASPLGALASTTLQSWRRRRGVCSRCDTRVSALSAVRSFGADVTMFSRMTWLDYITRLKHKDLVPIPWLVAMALQMDGWYLRGDQIWAKGYSFHPTTAGSCMPESVRDRPTRAHEYLFLLTKSATYYYDHEAVKENSIKGAAGSRFDRGKTSARDGGDRTQSGYRGQCARNLRSVWLISPQPFRGAHFAVFPPSVVEPCVKAGSCAGDSVLDPFCGSGVTGLVALRLGRSFVGIELNANYVEMAHQRIEAAAPLLNHVRTIEAGDTTTSPA